MAARLVSTGPGSALSDAAMRAWQPPAHRIATVTAAPVAAQLEVLLSGAESALPAGELERQLTAVARGERPPLRVKFGVDPTAPDIHLGHTVPLRRLRDFQRFGHTAILLIGGFTARVGDPSDRSTTRPQLTAEEVAANAATYLDQARVVLDDDNLEIRDNTEWLAPMGMDDVLRLTAQMTVAQMLERDDFARRYADHRPIAVSEFLYPLLQGWDSVALHADVELGGSDQTFNLLAARPLQANAGQPPQSIITLPLIEGTDGVAKMSKTANNAIGVTEAPHDVFGKVMRIPDALMGKWFRYLTDTPPGEVDGIEAALANGSLHPGQTKRRLARTITATYHDDAAAAAAEARFDRQFVQRGIPDDIATHVLTEASVGLASLLTQVEVDGARMASSLSEARRLVAQGGVRLDGEVQDDALADLPARDLDGRVLQVGKRKFARLQAATS